MALERTRNGCTALERTTESALEEQESALKVQESALEKQEPALGGTGK